MTQPSSMAPVSSDGTPPEVHYEIVDRIAYITIDRREARCASTWARMRI